MPEQSRFVGDAPGGAEAAAGSDMLHSSSWKRFPSYHAELELEEEHSPEVSAQEHDLILRYAIVGIFVILATCALYLTRVIALPVTAGVIFGLVLGPIVDAMARRGVPQHLAAAIVVLLGALLLLSAIAVLTVPIAAWSDQLPAMLAALKTKLAGLFVVFDQFKQMAGDIAGGGDAKISVSDGSNPLIGIAITSSTAAGGLLIFVATVYFWLATRRHLKARTLRLCLGRSARKSASAFFEEIETRAAHYFGLVTIINLGMGLATMAIAWMAGLPYPVFWGALAFLLNYLAFIGPIIVTVLLFAAGLLSSPEALTAVWPAAAYFVIHLIEGNAVTPIFVGRRLTISPFLVFISFIFWLWLWGPVGAVLSTPILLIAIVAREEFVKYRLAETLSGEAERAAAA